MKSKFIFFIGMLSVVALYVLFDYLKSTVFLVTMHDFFVKLKTVVIILGGIVTMFLSLNRKVFKIFMILYLSLYTVYGVLKVLKYLFMKAGLINAFDRTELITINYVYYTKIFTITPFVFFFCCLWLITKVLDKEHAVSEKA